MKGIFSMEKKLEPANLLVCRSLTNDPVLKTVSEAIASPQSSAADAIAALIDCAENCNLSGNILRSYIVERLVTDKNLVNCTLERSGGQIGASLREAFIHDMEILLPLFTMKPTELIKDAHAFLDDYKPTSER